MASTVWGQLTACTRWIDCIRLRQSASSAAFMLCFVLVDMDDRSYGVCTCAVIGLDLLDTRSGNGMPTERRLHHLRGKQTINVANMPAKKSWRTGCCAQAMHASEHFSVLVLLNACPDPSEPLKCKCMPGYVYILIRTLRPLAAGTLGMKSQCFCIA